jgi:cytochrome o ubiquinol oxidase subunit 2
MLKISKPTRVIIVGILFVLFLLALAAYYISHHTIAVMQPAGPIALQQRNLMYATLLLSALVVIPVYVMTIVISVRYRAGNPKKATYKPDWDNNNRLEFVWWAIPFAIIGWLSVITWNTSHSLDPFRPIASSKPTIPIRVVALDWKWLFIYPDGVATVNQANIPQGQPINFNITSDAVMNSFWVPQLGGQIYAMPGMSTQLHLEASRPGSFFGSPANIAGAGYARMDFTVKSLSPNNYSKWLASAKRADKPLTLAGYNQLTKPSDNYPVTIYSSSPGDLYDNIVDKYMAGSMPQSETVATQGKGQ